MTTYLALLRGINVGGKNKVSMSELKSCFEQQGFGQVTTFINSGNVIFTSDEHSISAIEAIIEKALHAHFSFAIRVTVRSFAHMQHIMQEIPKSWLASQDKRCNVIFLMADVDNPTIVKQLNPKAGIDELHYHPGVLFWSADTSNITKSGMSKIIGTPMYKGMTIRIFNSVRTMYDLMRAMQKEVS